MQLPRSFHNRLSYAGTGIALLGLIAFAFLLFFHMVTDAGRTPYAGIVIFLLVPAVILFGVFLVPVGMIRERRRIRRTGEVAIPRFPVIDLNQAHYRNMVLISVVGGMGLLFLSVFGSYQAYELTESVAFCGRLCHNVMHPEYTAYQHSPHARVSCADCHIGPGADWFVRSKVTGLYQVYAVATDSYPRPIPTPIESLRPARETCEQCHWPAQFYGEKHSQRIHFLGDEANTRWRLDMRLKIGGGPVSNGQPGGIHWHMNLANRVEFFSRDAGRQEIPWVRVTDRRSGKVRVYASTSEPPTPEEIEKAEIRTMDCMDCHNRPTHIFHAPNDSVNGALAAGRISPDLPYVKKKGVELLAAEYPSKDEALAAIEEGLAAFYRKEYPKVAAARGDDIQQATAELQEIYRRNFFPRMKVRWDVYPNNVGHLTSSGCGRCHDGNHSTEGGQVLERSCDTCHVIVAQGPPGEVETHVDGLPFRHPEDIGGAWEFMPCSGCHTGALP